MYLLKRKLAVHCLLYLKQELMGFAEGTGLLWLSEMANGVRFFAPPCRKIEQATKRAAPNPYY